MTPERHALIQQIFEAAVELPAGQREPYLREACGGDTDLRLKIDQLIGADEEPSTESVKVCSVCSRCYDGSVNHCPADAARLDIALRGSLLIGGKYLIERQLGHGGMGAVYQVRHVALEKTFALKLIHADRAVIEWYRKSFETEARALGKLKHPNIVDVTDYGIDPRDGGVPYLVMEYLEGETLRQVLKKRKSIPFLDAAPMLQQIASAIDFAHSRNIIHADLKPGNLFLSGGVVKVVDFGLARFPSTKAEAAFIEPDDGVSTDATTVTMSRQAAAGTPPYMAPELFRMDAPTKASDRFAFGVIAYEMLTGDLAFGIEGCRSGRFHDPPLAPSSRAGLAPELDAPVLALVDPVPEHRPSSALAAVDTMRAAWLAARQREWLEKEVAGRMVLAAGVALAAVLLAALATLLPLAKTLEERTVDLRFGLGSSRPPDPRLLVVAIDDASLAQNPHPLAEWSPEMSKLLEHALAGGAKMIAIDALLPASWAASDEFTNSVLNHADRLTLAMESRSEGVIGLECIAPLTASLLGSERYSKLFGFVNVEEDQDHAIRHAHALFPGGAESFAARAAGTSTAAADPFWIDYSVRPQEIPTISFKDAMNAEPAKFSGRIVIIGATFSGSTDRLVAPSTISAKKISGVQLEAEIANTILTNYPLRGIPAFACITLAGTLCLVIVGLALRYPHRPAIALIATGGIAIGYTAGAFGLYILLNRMAIVVGPLFGFLLAIAAGWILKSRLSPYPEKDW
jgi:serine/threonine protein kinase